MKKWFMVPCFLLAFSTLAFAGKSKPLPTTSTTKQKQQKEQPTSRHAASPLTKQLKSIAAIPLYEKDSPTLRMPQKPSALRRILKSQVLRICTRSDVPPFGYFANTKLTGFDVALAKELAIQLSIFYKKNLLISWVNISAGMRITSLQQNRCDLVIAAFSYTKSRSKLVSFSKRYLKTEKVIVAKTIITRNKPIIALVRGTTNVAKGLTGEIKYYNSYKDIIFAMEKNAVDYTVTDHPIALHMIRSVTKSYSIIKTLPQKEIYGIGINKNNQALRKAVNLALQKLGNSGRLAYLYRQWL